MEAARHNMQKQPIRRAAISAIACHLPDTTLGNEQLARELGAWTADEIESKTGIRSRHVAAPDECASDLALRAAEKLFAGGECRPEEIDFLLLCTQTPDYFLPTTACLLQARLGIPTSCGALDFNLGCSGYIYGLGLARGLVETGQARKVLLLTADTYTKLIEPQDRSVRTLFGDAAAATCVSAVESEDALLGPFVYGTDGKGACNLIVPTGAFRAEAGQGSDSDKDLGPGPCAASRLHMNGPEVFTFSLQRVPQAASDLLKISGLTLGAIDWFVFHQANNYMLEHLRKKMAIPAEKFCLCLKNVGNTVSCSIPIALDSLLRAGKLRPGHLLMLVGFGVGYSWGATLVRWTCGHALKQ